MSTKQWTVRHVAETEFDAWTALFRGYAEFYEWPTSDEHQRQIWGWIHEDHSVEALVAVEIDNAGNEIGVPRGLAHLRVWVRPLRVRSAGISTICTWILQSVAVAPWRACSTR